MRIPVAAGTEFLETAMRDFESHDRRAQSADSSKSFSKPRAFRTFLLHSVLQNISRFVRLHQYWVPLQWDANENKDLLRNYTWKQFAF